MNENEKTASVPETEDLQAPPAEETSKEPDTAPAAESAAETESAPQKKKGKKEVTLENALAEKEAELAALQDKYLRLAAEYDNFRRRSQKEREGIYTDAVADAVRELLPIADNLERAVASGSQDSEGLAQGLSMTLKALEESLSRLGVESYGVSGDSFDPNLHNAVMHEEDPDQEENRITDVFQRGYRKGERIIRHAMVKVVN